MANHGLNSVKKRRKIAALRQRDGGDCFYCLDPLGAEASLEHLVSVLAGGSNELVNLVLAHRACNEAVDRLDLAAKLLLRGDALLARLAGDVSMPFWRTVSTGHSQMVELYRRVHEFSGKPIPAFGSFAESFRLSDFDVRPT